MKLIILGEPIGKGRPRFTTRAGYPKAYTPEKTAAYENLIKVAFLESKEEIFEKDMQLSMELLAVFSIPKNTSARMRIKMQNKDILPQKKPDIDNIAKVIMDALNGLAYHDDAQICNLKVSKIYGDNPRVEILLTGTKSN